MTVDSLCIFEAHQDRLFGVAYRMTGSVSDAQDIVQDAWLRWQAVDPERVDNPEAFLVRTTTRLAIDRARTATARHETYVGPDLPEPVIVNGRNDPQATAELADSMTFAFLVLLDELKPIERAVFLLHDVFGYSFDEIANSVDRTAVTCRQIASRTRKRVKGHLGVRRPSREHQQAVISQMIAFTIAGDIVALMTVLAPDVVQLDDGGAPRKAARRPIVGPERVARFIVNIAKRVPPNATMEFVDVNESAGLLFRVGGVPDMVMTFGWSDDGQIRRMYVQLNPEKLRHLS